MQYGSNSRVKEVITSQFDAICTGIELTVGVMGSCEMTKST